MDFNVFDWYYQDVFPKHWREHNRCTINNWDQTVSTDSAIKIAIQTEEAFDDRNQSKIASYYYEISLHKLDKNAEISVGFADGTFPQTKHFPGSTYGFKSKKGKLESGSLKKTLKPFGEGDIVGCGFNESHHFFCTLNGQIIFTTEKAADRGKWFPTVGLKGSVEFAFNLGESPFSFADIRPWIAFNADNLLKSQFANKQRYLTHITSDKPIYRPGDTVYFRGWILHALNQLPLDEFSATILNDKIRYLITSPSGAEVVSQSIARVVNSTVSGSWKIPSDLSGGDYSLKISYNVDGFPSAERKFNIREFSTPRLKLQLEFPTKGYGPGDKALAKLQVSRAEGGVPENAQVTSVARIDGEEVFRGTSTLDKLGNAEITFQLPKEISKGDGTLTCSVDDQGTVESTGQTIPILLRHLDMNVYPEGGYLVSGLPCKVYVEAFTPMKEPADFVGQIVDEKGNSHGSVQTMHEGRGFGIFTPKSGEKYFIKVLSPKGIVSRTPLPAVVSHGVVLTSVQTSYTALEPLTFRVGSTRAGTHRIEVCKRETSLLSTFIPIEQSNKMVDVTLSLGNSGDATGVLRVTLYDSSNTPQAERLVFRKPSGNLTISVECKKKDLKYSPRQRVNVQVKAFDENGRPVDSVVGVCVTDDSVLEMVEKRKQVPRLPVMLFFENEVDHLEDAHVYLDSKNPKSSVAVDLLLGTQGWRRFAYTDISKFLENSQGNKASSDANNNAASVLRAKNKDVAERMLAVHEGAPVQRFLLPMKSPPTPYYDYGPPVPSPPRAYSSPPPPPGGIPVRSPPPPSPISAPPPARSVAPSAQVVKSAPVTANVAPQPTPSTSTLSTPTPKPAPVSPRLQNKSVPSPQPVPSSQPVPSQQAYSGAPLSSRSAPSRSMLPPMSPAAPPPPPGYYSQRPPSPPPTIPTLGLVREFSHKADSSTDTRNDFTETLYWHAGMKLSTQADSQGKVLKAKFDKKKLEVSTQLEASAEFSSLKFNGVGSGVLTTTLDQPLPGGAPTALYLRLDAIGSQGVSFGFASPSQSQTSRLGSSDQSPAFWVTSTGVCQFQIGYGSSSQSDLTFLAGDVLGIHYFPKNKTVAVSRNGELYEAAFIGPIDISSYYPAVSLTPGSHVSLVNKPQTCFSFDMNDSISSFRIWAEGVSASGAVGTATALITSTNPFYMEYKLPIEATSGDELSIPVTLVNNSTSTAVVTLAKKSSDNGELVEFLKAAKSTDFVPLQGTFTVEQNARHRLNVEALIRHGYQLVNLSLRASSTSGEVDTVSRNFRVVPFGFPYLISAAGQLKENSKVSHSFSLPEKMDKSSITTSAVLYISPLSNMTQALRALVREPYGCFEQTSSVVYPMVMAQQYFATHTGVDDSIIKQANTHITAGYNRLTGFEVKDNSGKVTGGFDWYGSSPANESLTAYGLLEFNDMKEVFPIDGKLLPRVRSWLLSRKDGKGKFLRGSGRYGFGNAPEDITNAYIVWALTESGETGESLQPEIDHLIAVAEKSKKDDPYYLALLTCALFNVKHKDASRFGYLLTELQTEEGAVVGKHAQGLHDTRFTTITYSWGDGLWISSTSLAVFAWLKSPSEYIDFIEKGMRWVFSKCKDGRFGDTQSTILALKAIVEYDKQKSPWENSVIEVVLNGKKVSEIILDEKLKGQGSVEVPSFAEHLAGGNHKLEFVTKGKVSIPYSFALNYNATKPDNDPDCVVELTTKLSSSDIQEGEGGEVMVSMKNKDKSVGQPMVLAIIGLPGGLEPRHEQLQELVKGGVIDFYEVIGREVAVYLREMGPGQVVSFKIDVVAKIPGKYSGQASRIYLYYTNESKHWNDPMTVTIKPAKE